VRVQFAGRGLLFPGDVEADGESELVANGAAGLPLASEVLKVPHHGSRTSSSAELLDAVTPRLAVISLGRQNRFQFPRPEVLRRYRERGVPVIRTDESGAVTIRIDRRGEIAHDCVRGCQGQLSR
jgi:competence protein ComEC